jgi:hypothetical protein
MKDESEEV